MIPVYELVREGQKSAFLQVAQWIDESEAYRLPSDEFDDSFGDVDMALGLAIPSEFLTFNQRLRGMNRQRRPERKPDWNALERRTTELAGIVADAIGGDVERLSSLRFSDAEKRCILNVLHEKGFRIPSFQFIHVIRVAQVAIPLLETGKFKVDADDLDAPLRTRYASLNCYDYQRLLLEFENLRRLFGMEKLTELCPTLTKIVCEAQAGGLEVEDGKASYPGRHLPIAGLKGERIKCYQTLRVMDEILATSPNPLRDDAMSAAILTKFKEYGVDTEQNIPSATLRKYYAYLRQLINVEHTCGRERAYSREVYVDGRRGHLYRMLNDSQRLCAFAVDIDVSEAPLLRQEVDRLKSDVYDSEAGDFGRGFPQIAFLGRLERLAEEISRPDRGGRIANEIRNASMWTINYLPQAHSGMRDYVEDAIAGAKTLEVNPRACRNTRVIPLCIRERGNRWALAARSVGEGRMMMLDPEMIVPGSARDGDAESLASDADELRYVVGMAPLQSPEPVEFTLILTDRGYEEVMDDSSPLNPLVVGSRRNPVAYGELSQRGERTYTVDIQAYVNDDLLEEFFQLDAKGKLIDVKGLESEYDGYFEQRQGRSRVPYEERNPNSRRFRKRGAADE